MLAAPKSTSDVEKQLRLSIPENSGRSTDLQRRRTRETHFQTGESRLILGAIANSTSQTFKGRSSATYERLVKSGQPSRLLPFGH